MLVSIWLHTSALTCSVNHLHAYRCQLLQITFQHSSIKDSSESNPDVGGCREYADFRVSSDGEVQGVGLLIAQEPGSGRLVVLAPIRGGPADKAGVLPGDEVSSRLQGHD